MTGAAESVVARLTERGLTVAVAESLTGGLLGAALTEVPGASAVFRGGVTAYATELKARLLGLDAGLLTEHGPVDPRVASGMAEGVRRLMQADWGLSTTGVAGPSAQDGAPIGTVFVGCSGPPGTVVRQLALSGDRAKIRAASVASALELLLEQLTLQTAAG
ncbi:MAG: nicotinamide-nucleotide amidase [Frankiales bacterium]|jgi:nicotinamide-nucleotide amidase|nr:nicotinamide-nucleotide amidase [Frankiales bacterium]